MKIILIEDDNYKADKIIEYLNYLGHNVILKQSYNSGLREILRGDYEFALLDMTLPTFDTSHNNTVNFIRHFGGEDIISELQRREKYLPSLVVTQYQTFDSGEKSIDELNEELFKKYSPIYKGVLYYNSSTIEWQKELREYLETGEKDDV